MNFRFGGTLMDDEYAKIMRWYGYSDNVCPADIRNLCRDAAGEEIVLEVNCDGGDIMVGNEIYSVLRDYSGRVVAHIQSRSASAATVAMMGADEITAEPVALVCVHNPTTWAVGDNRRMQGAADSLNACKEIILNAYMGRARVSKEELSALMDRDIFITAEKAVEYGIVDSIREPHEGDVLIVAGTGAVHFPTEKMVAEWREMKAREKAENNAGGEPADQNGELEKKRLLANAFLAKYR